MQVVNNNKITAAITKLFCIVLSCSLMLVCCDAVDLMALGLEGGDEGGGGSEGGGGEEPPPVYSLGDTGPAGGLIFYIENIGSDGWQYYEAAPSDQSTSAVWATVMTQVGGTEHEVGYGESNTAIIVSAGVGSEAATICNDLVLGGYSDWFLPSERELAKMSSNLHKQGLGDFNVVNQYWSSTELKNTSNRAIATDFPNSGYSTKNKDETHYVRAARRFK